jgi:UDP-glucose 4-epimerase
MAMKVLVTGSSGFVGLALSEALIRKGHEVIGFDKRPPPFRRLEGFTFVQGDIGTIQSFSPQFKAKGITHIVHAAAMTPSQDREYEAPDAIAETNIVGSYRLMLLAADMRPKRVVYISSVSAYGPAAPEANGRYDEQATRAAPEALYGISKLAAETGMRRIAQLSGVDLRVVRLGPVFGAWEHPSGARDILSPHHQVAAAIREGKPCILPRPLPADWIYSRDAARRIAELLMRQDLSGDLFNLGGGTITTLEDWCKALAALVPGFCWSIDAKAPTIRHSYAIDRPALDNRRIDAAVPAEIRTSLTDAAKDYWAWAKDIFPLPEGAL